MKTVTVSTEAARWHGDLATMLCRPARLVGQSTAVLAALISMAQPGWSAPPAKHTPAMSSQCKALRAQYDDMGQSKATDFAEHNSDEETLSHTRMIMDLMRDNHCPMPTAEPEYKKWIVAAFKCRLAKMKARDPLDTIEPCDRTKWQPDASWGK